MGSGIVVSVDLRGLVRSKNAETKVSGATIDQNGISTIDVRFKLTNRTGTVICDTPTVD